MSILQKITSLFAPKQPPPVRAIAWIQLDYDVPTNDYVKHFHDAARRFARSDFVHPTVMPTIHLEPGPGQWGDVQQRKAKFMRLLTTARPLDPMFGARNPDDEREAADIRRAIESKSIALFDAQRKDGRRFIGILTWTWKN